MSTKGLADSPLFREPKKGRAKGKKKEGNMISSNHDTMVSVICRSINDVGKKAQTIRLTRREKLALAKLVFQIRLGDNKVSENEIIRIAINYILFDHTRNENSSFLNEVYDFLQKTRK